MALSIRTAVQFSGGRKVHTCSTVGRWHTIHSDARTAQTAANLLHPLGVTDSLCGWLPLNGAGFITCVRARVPIATTAVGTSPIIQLFLGWGELDSSGVPLNSALTGNDGVTPMFRVERLDNAVLGAAGLTLTFDATPAAATDSYNDGIYFFSTSVLQTPTDLRGASHLFCAVATAGACTASAVMPVEACFVN